MTLIMIMSLFIGIELITYFVVFKILGKMFLEPDNKTKTKVDANDMLKGMVERFVLAFALAKGLPQILIFFGAMKLGTRLKSDIETEHFNNYFLVGNLISVLLAICYSVYLTKDNISYLQSLVN